MKPGLLLHTCCAPCLIGTLPYLGEFEISCFWYNPNIHPFTEYSARQEALRAYAAANGIKLIVKDDYGLIEFTRNVINNLDGRCRYCYDTRIKEAAKYAGEHGFDMFSTTLLVSPYQDREKINRAGEKYGGEYKTEFFYGDFRENFKNGQQTARNLGIYRQKYCGCMFSERERYIK